MKFNFYLLVISLFLFLTSCETEHKITFKEIEILVEGNSIVNVNIPKAEGDSELSNNINNAIIHNISQSLNFGDENMNS